MDKILLILSTTRKSDKSVEEAVEIASKENAKLINLFIVDYEVPQKIFDSLTEEGWIGGKTTKNLYNAVLDEYSVLGKEKILEVEEAARNKGINYKSIIKSGTFVDVALSVAEKEQVNMIIVTRRKRSHLSRFFFGSAVAELKEKVTCEIKIIDE
ncbi:universal stress protein and related nucleotide-binding proteins [Candidatus Scalindua japonica]|uniref:Universal stress protein and related nucleotide-binding proteins n=1 Tax=Candidatus Scalindua japonica TaxID=1284222 RepID=A0A286U0L1_9BACT|nr:universal stress protein [Candidatus Scalindua japonica]GAX61664.1 universal stress protein and related nucleotide-binding proteins [Candidatus Scalindua japonica]